ncbi:hypothetical protein ABIE00_000041 [Arthrobacter sp. OAP107]
MSTSMVGLPVIFSVVVPDAVDLHAQPLQVEAEVLDHVIGAGVADDRGAAAVGGGHDGIFGHGVAALGQHKGPVEVVGGRCLHGVEA